VVAERVAEPAVAHAVTIASNAASTSSVAKMIPGIIPFATSARVASMSAWSLNGPPGCSSTSCMSGWDFGPTESQRMKPMSTSSRFSRPSTSV